MPCYQDEPPQVASASHADIFSCHGVKTDDSDKKIIRSIQIERLSSLRLLASLRLRVGSSPRKLAASEDRTSARSPAAKSVRKHAKRTQKTHKRIANVPSAGATAPPFSLG